jgi:hypothetical protein
MRIKSLLSGVISCFPGGNTWLFRRDIKRNPGVGNSNPRYCYSVWLRHLVLVNKYFSYKGVPNAVAELGPGESLGTGLAALISGANRYYAFDVVPHVKNKENIKIFSELVRLFEKKEDIPNSKEFPQIHTELDDYGFPSDILSEDVLEPALKTERLAEIKLDLVNEKKYVFKPSYISYVVPWYDTDIIAPDSIDMIFSMSVLEHTDDLKTAYQASYNWLKEGGFMSHEIDFRCHGHSHTWNGHWGYSDFIWRLMRGCRPYFINRKAHSSHINLIKENGFKIIADLQKFDQSGIKRHELAPQFRGFSNDDICTYSAFILSTKSKRSLS